MDVDAVPSTPAGPGPNSMGDHPGAAGTARTADAAPASVTIASGADLDAFARVLPGERYVTDALRGVLAETALTGVVRYPWSLLRPLVEHVMEQVLLGYETREAAVRGDGPSKPLSSFGDVGVHATLERYKTLLTTFSDAPWTLQRICEILLEPQKQYNRLHKVVLALERCLLVTSEVAPAAGAPPPPLLSSLTGINDNPPPVYTSTHPHSQSSRGHSYGHGGSGQGGPGGRGPAAGSNDTDDSAAFTGSVLEVRAPATANGPTSADGPVGGSSPPGAGSSGHGHGYGAHAHGHHPSGGHGHGIGSSLMAVEHLEEDHWPEANGLYRHGGGTGGSYGLAAHHALQHGPMALMHHGGHGPHGVLAQGGGPGGTRSPSSPHHSGSAQVTAQQPHPALGTKSYDASSPHQHGPAGTSPQRSQSPGAGSAAQLQPSGASPTASPTQTATGATASPIGGGAAAGLQHHTQEQGSTVNGCGSGSEASEQPRDDSDGGSGAHASSNGNGTALPELAPNTQAAGHEAGPGAAAAPLQVAPTDGASAAASAEEPLVATHAPGQDVEMAEAAPEAHEQQGGPVKDAHAAAGPVVGACGATAAAVHAGHQSGEAHAAAAGGPDGGGDRVDGQWR